MIKFLRVLFFTFVSFTAFAQTPSLRIIKVNSENYCLGTELSLDVDITGTFPAGNKFTVVAYRNWNDPAQRWEYPAELRGDKLVTVLREPRLANAQNFALKVLTSAPQSEIEWNYSLRALTKPSLYLTSRWGFKSDTINSTDAVSLAVTASPASPGDVIMNTGDTIKLIYPYDFPAPYSTPISLSKTVAGSYYIKSASNICGPMSVSGEVNIKINPIDFIPIAVSPQQPCGGGEIRVLFNTASGEFGSGTRFRIRFANDNGNMDSYRYWDVPATLTGKNELTARIPENLNGLNGYGVYIGIVTENPSSVSIAKNLQVYINPTPSFKLTTEKSSIVLGESVYLSTNPTGIPPYKVTLTSGEVIDYWKIVSPQETTSYQVKTFESGCGVLQNPANTPHTVVVQPSLLLGEPSYSENPRVLCEGTNIRIGMKTYGVNAQTSYQAEGLTYSGKKVVFPAKRVGDSLEIFIQKNTSTDPELDYTKIYGIRAVASNPTAVSPSANVKIQSPPTLALATGATTSVAFPSVIRLDVELRGGAPYIAEYADGTKFTYDYSNVAFHQFVRKDTLFKLARLSNSCFVNNNPSAITLKVTDPANETPNLFAKLIETGKCVDDSVSIELFFSGEFEPGNQFTLSFMRDGHFEAYAIQNVTKPGIYKVKFPARTEAGYGSSLQLSSTLPRIVSETGRFYLGVPPKTPSISERGSKDYPESMYLGNSPSVMVYGSAYSEVGYSVDGVVSKAMSDHNGMYGVPLPLQNGKISEFKLQSITNTCGVWNGEIIAYFKGIGYKTVINSPVYGVWNCVGTDADVRFSFENGKPGPGTKFTVQISPSGDVGSYIDVASASDSQVIRFTTPNVKAGSYYMRIFSSDNIYSETKTFLIGQAPTASTYTNDPAPGSTTASVDYGKYVSILTSLTGNPPFGIIYSDGLRQTTTDNYASYYSKITGPKTFSVAKVWNSCGYGTATGSVNVTIKPVLEISKYPANADASICPGQKIELDYAIRGAEISGNGYLVFSLEGEKGLRIKLDSVSRSSGRIQLTIPGNLTGVRFNIKAEIAALKLSQNLFYQLYSTPDLTLSGDNIITAGETTNLFVRSNATFSGSTSFELSDGKSFIHTAPYPGGIMTINVSPSATTTYTIKPMQSVCGTGKVSGAATITVEPKLSQWLSMQRVEGWRRSNVCNSDTIRVYFYHQGFDGKAVTYEVLLSDSTGKNFTALPSFGDYSPISAIIPATLKQSSFYRLRVVAKDAKVSGSTFSEPFRVGERARAKVLTPIVAYKEGQVVSVLVGLTGTTPFYYRYGDNNFFRFRTTNKETDTISFTPITPLATYKISDLTNECGVGIIEEPSSFRIEVITATEPLGEPISFGPNPTTGTLFVRFETAAVRNLEIVNVSGQKVFANKYASKTATVDISAFPPGVYVLQVKRKQTVASYRIIKY